jgi:hypothetical protein
VCAQLADGESLDNLASQECVRDTTLFMLCNGVTMLCNTTSISLLGSLEKEARTSLGKSLGARRGDEAAKLIATLKNRVTRDPPGQSGMYRDWVLNDVRECADKIKDKTFFSPHEAAFNKDPKTKLHKDFCPKETDACVMLSKGILYVAAVNEKVATFLQRQIEISPVGGRKLSPPRPDTGENANDSHEPGRPGSYGRAATTDELERHHGHVVVGGLYSRGSQASPCS